MKMLFLGGCFSSDMEGEILYNSKGIVQYAANNLQWTLIDGFMSIKNLDLEVLSAPFIGTYPKDYKKLFVNQYKGVYKNKIDCKYVASCNLWGYRNISRKNSLKRSIQDFINVRDNKKVIIVYSPHTPFLQAAVYAKEKDPSIQICLVVPDLPQYMNLDEKKSFFYKQFKKVDIKMFENLLDKVDSFVIITKAMKDMLNIGSRPYVVVEGAISNSQIDLIMNSNNKMNSEVDIPKNKKIVYTGTLNKKFGIVNLTKAFTEIDDPDISLLICGRGDAAEDIERYARKDSRIKYLGQVSNEDAIYIQRSATILVNPRPNNEEFTKYSFPIKTMEYLLSGKPVIAFKLDGIPNEYDDYIFYIENNSIEAIKNKIIGVLKLPEQDRLEFGNRARYFVLENKNSTKTGFKIYNMINKNFI